MRNYKAQNVKAYIAAAEPEARPTLMALRKVVLSAVPKAEEQISWGVPFYRYFGLLAGYSAFKNHATFGLVFALDPADRRALEKKGYKTGSKTIQIRYDQKVPVGAIKKLLIKRAKFNRDKK